jgi:hypothetical protein
LEDVINIESAKTYYKVLSGPEQDILWEETRLSCMQSLLACLTREVRIVFILGEVFGVTSEEGAYILDITPESFRKKLSRARGSIQNFMVKNCGLVNENNPCLCNKHTCRYIGLERINPEKKESYQRSRSEALMHLKELSEIERVSVLFRSYPENQCPESFKKMVKELIDSGRYGIFIK